MYSWLMSEPASRRGSLSQQPVSLSRATAYPKNILWVHEKIYFSR